MATAGADGRVKVWDNRNWGKTVREWSLKSGGRYEVDWSGRGLLAVSSKCGVSVSITSGFRSASLTHILWQVYRDLHTSSSKPPSSYMSMPLPGLAPRSIRFCPYEDVLGVGHSAGFSSMLVPGAGIAQYDSGEADVYESYGRRREREVRSVMEKIQPDLITMDTDAFLGRVGDGGVANRPVHGPNIREVPFYKKTRAERLEVLGTADTEGAGVMDEEDGDSADGSDEEVNGVKKPGQGAKRREKIRQEKEKHKMRGKSKSSKRFLRKKRKNVVDPTTVSIRSSARYPTNISPLGRCQREAGTRTRGEGQTAQDSIWRAQGRERRLVAIRVKGMRGMDNMCARGIFLVVIPYRGEGFDVRYF